jgi:hypothetical protein
MGEKLLKLKKLAEFFQEANGDFSSIRLLSIVWVLGIFTVWAYVTIRTRTCLTISPEILAFASSLVLYKVGQKFGEKPPGA